MSEEIKLGPWAAVPANDRLQRFYILCQNDICCPGKGKKVIAEHVRTKAEADLLAASPDLLEALEKIADYGPSAFKGDFTAVQIAKDAITKARGENV